jgi:hypothetical protein
MQMCIVSPSSFAYEQESTYTEVKLMFYQRSINFTALQLPIKIILLYRMQQEIIANACTQRS